MQIKSESGMLKAGQDFALTLMHRSDFGTNPIVIELVGDVGAGKTTFTRGLARGLGIKSEVTSPSFTISKSYAFKDQSDTPRTLTHYDFYRLQDPGLMQDDLAESIASSCITIVEWADSVENILPKDRITINISYNDDDTRELIIR